MNLRKTKIQHKGKKYIRNVIDLKNELTRLWQITKTLAIKESIPSDQFLDSFSIAFVCFYIYYFNLILFSFSFVTDALA